MIQFPNGFRFSLASIDDKTYLVLATSRNEWQCSPPEWHATHPDHHWTRIISDSQLNWWDSPWRKLLLRSHRDLCLYICKQTIHECFEIDFCCCWSDRILAILFIGTFLENVHQTHRRKCQWMHIPNPVHLISFVDRQRKKSLPCVAFRPDYNGQLHVN